MNSLSSASNMVVLILEMLWIGGYTCPKCVILSFETLCKLFNPTSLTRPRCHKGHKYTYLIIIKFNPTQNLTKLLATTLLADDKERVYLVIYPYGV